MSDRLQQARDDLDAAEAELARAMIRYGDMWRERFGDTLPDVPDDDTLASLGRYGEGKDEPAPTVG